MDFFKKRVDIAENKFILELAVTNGFSFCYYRRRRRFVSNFSSLRGLFDKLTGWKSVALREKIGF
jgi:hypothetical protein